MSGTESQKRKSFLSYIDIKQFLGEKSIKDEAELPILWQEQPSSP